MSRNASVLSVPLEQTAPLDSFDSSGFVGLVQNFPGVRFSPDSRFLVVGVEGPQRPGAGNSTLLIADLAAGRVVARVQPGSGWGIGPASKVLVVSTMAGDMPTLHAYALDTGRQIGEFTSSTPSQEVAGDIASYIAPDDRRMVLPIRKGTRAQEELKFFVWQFDGGHPIPIEGSWAAMLGRYQDAWAHFDADGARLLTCASQRTGPNTGRYAIELWDLAGPRRLLSTADSAPELAMAPPRLLCHPRQRAFATVHNPQKNPEGSVAILWESTTGKLISRHKGYQAELSEDGEYVEVKDKGSSYLVSLKTHEVRDFGDMRLHMYFGVPGRRTAVASPTVFVQRPGAKSLDGLTLTDVETGRTRAFLADQVVLHEAFTPDGKRLATLSKQDPTALCVWEVETGKLLRSVPLHNVFHRSTQRGLTTTSQSVTDAHFSPDGKRLSFNLNDRFRVLDIESGRLVAIDRPGHRAAIRAVDLSPDGTLVASAGDDAAVCLWEAATGRFVAMLEEENEPIAAVAFSPDGRSLAARAVAGRVRVWRLERAQAKDRIMVVATPAWDTTSLGSAAGASATSGPVFVSEGRLVAFGAGDGTISLRDTPSGRVERILKPESGKAAVTALTAPADGCASPRETRRESSASGTCRPRHHAPVWSPTRGRSAPSHWRGTSSQSPVGPSSSGTSTPAIDLSPWKRTRAPSTVSNSPQTGESWPRATIGSSPSAIFMSSAASWPRSNWDGRSGRGSGSKLG